MSSAPVAASSKVAVHDGPQQYCRFAGPRAPNLQHTWAQLHADVALWQGKALHGGTAYMARCRGCIASTRAW